MKQEREGLKGVIEKPLGNHHEWRRQPQGLAERTGVIEVSFGGLETKLGTKDP